MDPAVQIAIAYAFALLWLTGAATKVTRFWAFGATVREYRLLPPVLALPSAAIVIAFEAVLGIALLVPGGRSQPLVASAALLALYAVAMSLNLLRGRRHIDCGCMGPGFGQPLSERLVGRNLALAVLALAGSLPVQARVLLWVDVISIVATVTFLAALYATFNGLLANSHKLKGLGS